MKPDSTQDDLIEALQRFIERVNWFTLGRTPEEGLETDKVQLLLAEWDEHVLPHLPSAKDAHIIAEIRKVEPAIATMRARVRLIYANHLHKLVEARFYWLQWEKAVTAPVLLKQRLDEAAPEQRAVILTAVNRLMGREFDASTLYREAMEAADSREETWKKQRAQFQKDWPDEITPETASRLQTSDATACALWMAELLSEMFAIGREHPCLAGKTQA